MARQFYCKRCGAWWPVPRFSTTDRARMDHTAGHRADVEMFDRPDLLELDAMLNGFYGGEL